MERPGSEISRAFPLFEPGTAELRFSKSPSRDDRDQMAKAFGKKILLVDDDRNLLTILASELRSSLSNFFILTAEDGERALKVLESVHVDLVVTDLGMPVMDGFELIRHIKKKYPAIDVIVMSSDIEIGVQMSLEALGVSRYIQKPFKVSTLKQMIQHSIPSESLASSK